MRNIITYIITYIGSIINLIITLVYEQDINTWHEMQPTFRGSRRKLFPASNCISPSCKAATRHRNALNPKI